ncbi:hypothetical protein QBC35DRAFT_490389 [Podospora australis]|uniref:CCHC-type domain-containing protein n=1 Tax=Podospora australis TaxID=1536484 RepID=A0AAN7AJ02_9PEZI|nr:hypothetical protein QBC35DRAFT_490389 [Podospora australis]
MAPEPLASLPSMAKQSTPKTMSSRLMTMKFMQRGAAAAAAATPEAASPATPKSEEPSSSKRRKFSHAPSSVASTPATPLYDQKAIQEALEEEEKKRLAAVEKRAAELGDSHWVLPGVSAKPKSKPLNVVQVGFAQIDYTGSTSAYSDNPFEESSALPPQPQFRRFNLKKPEAEKKEKKDDDDSDGSSDADSDDNSDDDNSAEDRKRGGRGQARGRRDTLDGSATKRARSSVSLSSKREEERKKAQQLAGKRRQKEVKLNQLSSISSSGAQTFQQRPASNMTCHGCGKVGHKVSECPKKRR